MHRLPLWLLVIAVTACAPEDVDRPSRPDSGPRPDAGPGLDAGPRPDAGPRGIVIDGVFDDPEYADAVEAVNESAATTGSRLLRLRGVLDEGRLVVALEASLAVGDTVLLYVDVDPGRDSGVRPDALTDAEGALDTRLARQELDLPAASRLDFAWATRVIPGSDGSGAEFVGWRALGDGDAFEVVDGAPTVCSDQGCETAIPLAVLDARGTPGTFDLFARVLGEDGSLAAETLPEEGTPTSPSIVRTFLTVAEPERPDAGVDGGVDGGIDAGPPGILVDGVLSEAAWASAASATNSAPPQGIFAPGNTLTRLRAVREPGRLVLGIEGTLAPAPGQTNTIVLYVDGDFGAGDPRGTLLLFLEDELGAVDAALSRFWIDPLVLRVDAAWATLAMNVTASAGETRVGWRDVRRGYLYAPLDPSRSPSACGPSACELAVPLDQLDVAADGQIAIFARLGDANSDVLSTQTLPQDDPSLPEQVGTVLLLAP